MLLSSQYASLQTQQHCSSRPMASPVQYRVRAQCLSQTGAGAHAPAQLQHGDELDDSFTGLDAGSGLMTVAGFGSLLSERSARTTFPNLQNFRPGRLYGYRRVFAHTADIFFQRGIANAATGEISSLSCEPLTTSSSAVDQQQPDSSSSGSNSITQDASQHSTSRSGGASNSGASSASLVVSLFEVPYTPDNIAAFIQREHEFRFLAVQPYDLTGKAAAERLAVSACSCAGVLLAVPMVLCGANTDEHYRATRCPPDEWQRRWAVHGIDSVWRSDVLPCRVYLRHCVLAAKGFCQEAYDSFLDNTYLADRGTTIREYLAQHPEIMEELPPPELVGRYSG